MICMSLLCTLASLLVLFLGAVAQAAAPYSGHHRADITCVDLSEDAAGLPVATSQLFHKSLSEANGLHIFFFFFCQV